MTATRTCSIPECGKPHNAKGLCRKHYSRLQRTGDPHETKRVPPGEVQDFYANVVLSYEGEECLTWPYGTSNGYANMIKGGKRGVVSRFLCEDIYGPPPSTEHQAAHSCGNGHLACVARSHLRWATPSENSMDRLIHGTHNRGERNSAVRLTEVQAREILALKGLESQTSIARRFGIAPQTVFHIHKGNSWSWLSGGVNS